MKKLVAGLASTVMILAVTAIPSFAATVDLPPEFASISPIFEIVLKVVEFLAKIISFFG